MEMEMRLLQFAIAHVCTTNNGEKRDARISLLSKNPRVLSSCVVQSATCVKLCMSITGSPSAILR